MLLRAGEILQGRTKRFLRHNTQVDLHIPRTTHARFRVSLQQHSCRSLPGNEMLHDRRGPLAFHHDVEIANRFAPASPAACTLHPPCLRTAADPDQKLLEDPVRFQPEQAGVGRVPGEGKIIQDGLLCLRAESLERRDPPLLTGQLQSIKRVDCQRFHQQLDLPRTETRHPQHLPHHGRNLCGELIEQR